MALKPLTVDWIAPLAEPYLRGYRPIVEHSGRLRGCWFLSPASSLPGKARSERYGVSRFPSGAGFFAGYLESAESFGFLAPRPPECLVFAFLSPVGGRMHRRLVDAPDSLLKWTSTYIRWLTHHPPRFEFYEREPVALVRHSSMLTWPSGRHLHLVRNFYVETLAWLVRSGLVRKLLAEPSRAGAGKPRAAKAARRSSG